MGYVTVYKPELKIKEWETFRAYYCGLCYAIGESCLPVASAAEL